MKRKREPKACEHQLTYTCDTDFLIKCAGCHAVVNKPEPPVEPNTKKTNQPERKAREWSILVDANGGVLELQRLSNPFYERMVVVREILPEDDK